MLLLALPRVIIGIVSSLILIVIMKVASVLQTMLWASLPTTFGFAPDSGVDSADADTDRYCGRPGDSI
jgi:hypothetical protein